MLSVKKITKENLTIFSTDLFKLYKEFFKEQNHINEMYPFNFSLEDFSTGLRTDFTKTKVILLTLFKGNQLIGFLRGFCKQDSGTFILHDLFIKNDFREKGHGKYFFRELQNQLKNLKIEKIELFVDVNNKIGFEFWENLGFKAWQIKMVAGVDRAESD